VGACTSRSMGRRLVPYNPHLDKISLPSFLAWYRAWELSPSWPYSRKESEKKRVLVACLREMGYGDEDDSEDLGLASVLRQVPPKTGRRERVEGS
jgi:hypothetical protein